MFHVYRVMRNQWCDQFPEWNAELQIGQVLGPNVRWVDPGMDSVGKLAFTYWVVTDRTEIQNGKAGADKEGSSNGLETAKKQSLAFEPNRTNYSNQIMSRIER